VGIKGVVEKFLDIQRSKGHSTKVGLTLNWIGHNHTTNTLG
jgi:hypothetical protein